MNMAYYEYDMPCFLALLFDVRCVILVFLCLLYDVGCFMGCFILVIVRNVTEYGPYDLASFIIQLRVRMFGHVWPGLCAARFMRGQLNLHLPGFSRSSC